MLRPLWVSHADFLVVVSWVLCWCLDPPHPYQGWFPMYGCVGTCLFPWCYLCWGSTDIPSYRPSGWSMDKDTTCSFIHNQSMDTSPIRAPLQHKQPPRPATKAHNQEESDALITWGRNPWAGEKSSKPGLEHEATRIGPEQSVTPQTVENMPGISSSRVIQTGGARTPR